MINILFYLKKKYVLFNFVCFFDIKNLDLMKKIRKLNELMKENENEMKKLIKTKKVMINWCLKPTKFSNGHDVLCKVYLLKFELFISDAWL